MSKTMHPASNAISGKENLEHRRGGSAGTLKRNLRIPAILLIVFPAAIFRAVCAQLESEPTTPDPLVAGKHNTSPISACIGYNPALLTFTIPATGGREPYFYHWHLNGTPIPGETQPYYDPPQLTSSGTYAFNCQISDSYGSVVFTLPKVITIVPDPQVSVSGGGVVCQQASITLLAVVTDGTGTMVCQWQVSADNLTYNSISGANSLVFNPDTGTAGMFYYRVVLYPSIGSCNNAISGGEPVTCISLPVTSPIFHL